MALSDPTAVSGRLEPSARPKRAIQPTAIELPGSIYALWRPATAARGHGICHLGSELDCAPISARLDQELRDDVVQCDTKPSFFRVGNYRYSVLRKVNKRSLHGTG